ncbi:MAG: MarR family transcriptional regulator [Pseudomonadota bacterium]
MTSPPPQIAESVLGDIRVIIRASDMQSKRLQRATGFTTAQALIVRAVSDLGEVTTRALSQAVSLSQATVTTVLDRLERHGYIERYRSEKDRRIVHARLTEKGEAASKTMPPLMDEQFLERFADLPVKRQQEISCALSDVAHMMNADATDAAAASNGRA